MLGLWALLALVQAAPPPPPQALAPDGRLAREQALLARVEPERLQACVRALCAFGPRTGGSSSNLAAAEHLRSAFEAAGLAARTLEDPPTWCHEERAWSVTLRTGDAPELLLASAWPLGFSPPGAGEAELALEPRAGAAWLSARVRRAREEVALLLVDGSTSPDGRYPVVFELGRPGRESRPVFALSRADGELVRAASARTASAPRIAWSLDARVFEGSPRTVEARLGPAPERADGAARGGVLFCAHGDSDAGGPGANDNASGAAIVLEIARAWSAAVREGLLPAPARPVRFAVWGREIHSSRAWLERERAAGTLPELVLNFDQSGFGAGDDRLFLEPDDDALAARAVELFEALLARHALAARGREPAAQLLPERWATNRSQGGTDAYVFSEDEAFRAAGGGAATLYASAWGEPRELARTPGRGGAAGLERVRIDADPHYHSAGDTPENTTEREPWNMAWCARTGWLLALGWLERAP